PAAGIVALFPGSAGFLTLVIAVVFAWGVKQAVIEPFAMTALMQVFFKVTEGQVPDPEWDARLEKATEKFREIKSRAAAWTGAGAQASAGPPEPQGLTQPPASSCAGRPAGARRRPAVLRELVRSVAWPEGVRRGRRVCPARLVGAAARHERHDTHRPAGASLDLHRQRDDGCAGRRELLEPRQVLEPGDVARRGDAVHGEVL